jgi:hypothetical protein
VDELVLSISSCPSVIISENTLNQCIEKSVVMVTLTIVKSVSPILLHTFLGVGNFQEGGPLVIRTPVKWSTIVESLRNTGVITRR